MSEFQDSINPGQSGTPRWVGLAVAVLAGVSLLSLGVGWSAINHAGNVQQSTDSLKQSNDALIQRLAKSEEVSQQVQSDLKVVTDKLNVTQADLVAARKQGRTVSVLSQKLTGLETSVRSELATKASTDDVKNLSGDVTGVKNDLADTKSNLQMARSEMGTLIARNHEEIDQLRRLGEREYVEFTIQRKSRPQKVGSIEVQLRAVNPRKNQFTIYVLADDKNFEKKNRSVNEPIFFYTNGSRQALELVINKVTKSSASGYLSAPKAAGTSAASNSSSSGQ
jgi:hypothetical protein